MDEDDEIPEGYTRVSHVLGMFKSFSGIDPAVLANAADRGNRVHKYCQAYALNEFIDEYDQDCVGYMKSFIPWFDENVEGVVMTEKRLNDHDEKFSGKFDMVAKIKGVPGNVLLDWKTPVKSCMTWELQMGAYLHLLHVGLNIWCHHLWVVQLCKEGKKAKVIKYGDNGRQLFLKALELYKFFNPEKQILH